MDYQAFKDHIAEFLWKTNDQDLINSMDSLILMANAELDRKLDITRREEVYQVAHAHLWHV